MSKEQVLRQAASTIVAPFVRAAAKLHISPNALTLTGLVISLVSAVIVGSGYLLAGGLVMLFSGLFDMIDGAVARSTGKTTKFGALMDSVSDRVSEAALLCALLVMYTLRGSTSGAFLLPLPCRSFLTSYIRARAEGRGWSVVGCSPGRASDSAGPRFDSGPYSNTASGRSRHSCGFQLCDGGAAGGLCLKQTGIERIERRKDVSVIAVIGGQWGMRAKGK